MDMRKLLNEKIPRGELAAFAGAKEHHSLGTRQ